MSPYYFKFYKYKHQDFLIEGFWKVGGEEVMNKEHMQRIVYILLVIIFMLIVALLRLI